MSKKDIVITSGDPAGCGPQIILGAISEFHPKNINFFVIGDSSVYKKISNYRKVKNLFNLIDVKTRHIEKLEAGKISEIAGRASLNYLSSALKLIKEKNIKRLITAPLSKEAAGLVSKGFSGHTEYLASHFKTKKIAMMMTSSKIKTILLTRHILLKKVSVEIEKVDVKGVVALTYETLKNKFKIKNPKIVLASFNPHAGVDTFMEREEKLLLKKLNKFNKKIYGPYPSDTIFTKEALKKYDCIICTYHDQAMIPFKLLSLREGVNFTLGLPIIRTSPSHGVAYDVVKDGKVPFHSSMLEAIKLAYKLPL